MNLQPDGRGFRCSRLQVAFCLSFVLHLLLVWPEPLAPPAADKPVLRPGAQQTLRATLVPASDVVRAAQPVERPAPAPAPVHGLSSSTKVAITMPDPLPPAVEATLPESSLRALRYAIARSVARDAMTVHAPGVRLAIEVRWHGRRVVAVTLLRSSGRDTVDARVLAAFKAAARGAVIPGNLPADGFAVELELDGGPVDPNNDERSPEPG